MGVRRLPVVPVVFPVQLVLGLPVGIERPRKRSHHRTPSPWMPATAKAKAAA